MLAASLSALWSDFGTNVPNVLGCCSLAMRDAAYFDLDGAGTLDGMETCKTFIKGLQSQATHSSLPLRGY